MALEGDVQKQVLLGLVRGLAAEAAAERRAGRELHRAGRAVHLESHLHGRKPRATPSAVVRITHRYFTAQAPERRYVHSQRGARDPIGRARVDELALESE